MATSSNPSDGQSTPHYVALRSSYRSLVAHFKAQPGDICDAFFEKGLITTAVRDFVRSRSVLEDEKAQKLMDSVIDKVELDPNVYYCLIGILKSEGRSADTIVEQLEEAFKAEKARADCVHSSEDSFHSLPDPDAQAGESAPKPKLLAATRFICPFCGKCTLMQFFSKTGCLQAAQSKRTKGKSLFPYLNHSSLSNDEKQLLESQLLDETKRIVFLFADTERSIITSLTKRVSISELKNYVANILTFLGSKEDIEGVKKSENLFDIFLSLLPYKSFLNYEILQKIVKQFGNDEDQQLMEEYVSQFREFCQRSVFEVPSNIFHDSDLQPGDKMFSVKLTKQGHALLGDVVAMRKKLADILKIDVMALQLCSITDGCITLRFVVCGGVAEKIFPLSQEQIDSLSEIHARIQESPFSVSNKEQLPK